MPSLEKLVEKFLFEPIKVNIGDVMRLLDAFGYRRNKKSGSEYVFHKKGGYPINVPTVEGSHVKLPYVKRLAERLDLEEWYEKNKEK